ncbi:MAG: S9 family peptidase [Sphingomonadales bacterium]|nr:S9 family peptidase [Sphingomonadales bacterium]
MKSLLSAILLTLSSNFILAQNLSVERIWRNYEFTTKSAGAYQMLQDGQHYVEWGGNGNLVKGDLSDDAKNKEILIPGSTLVWNDKPIEVAGFEFNASEDKVLLWTAPKAIYRRSFEAFYFLYDLNSKKLEALDADHAPQTLAEYSPDGTSVSYIHGNDIFIKELRSGKVTKVTQDGKRNKIINGTTDWVYEEEFAITKAYCWSPDSKYLAFLKFDEREVPEFQMAMYGQLYPEHYTYKYPKAGELNSKVTLHIVDLKSLKIQGVEVGIYEYIPRLNWSSKANQLVVQTMNRHQNELNYWLVDATQKHFKTTKFFTETSTTYIDVDNNLLVLQDGKSILRTSESSGFNHIYKLGFDGSTTPITKGDWDVIEFLGFDEQTQTIYYSSAELGAIYKSVYSIQIDGSQKKNLTAALGYNNATFLNGMKYFIHTYSNANTPPVICLRKSNGEFVKTLEENTALLDKMRNEKLSPRVFISIPTPSVILNASLIYPVSYDPTKKYPVFVNVYGGPGHNEVLDCWDGNDYFFHNLLAQDGYMVLSIDPRGTQYRGADFKKSTYLQLGKLEIQDVVEATKVFAQRSDVDASRLGIMGWSYGGFMSSLAMTKGNGLFKVGIAVAPVTNWRFYDNIYTERFMRTPQENAKGYDDNSPINFAKDLQGKYFLIHGAADDNVHYQNSMEMISALVKANKQFDLFIYPNKNHGIYGGNTRNHLFNMIHDYILKEL